jgi:hypothetical protein
MISIVVLMDASELTGDTGDFRQVGHGLFNLMTPAFTLLLAQKPRTAV